MSLKAFYVDDETIYAAVDSGQAAALYLEDTGATCEHPYPNQIEESELDNSFAEIDENERQTGRETSLRIQLSHANEPGMLACNV